jgi:hypothetical protein
MVMRRNAIKVAAGISLVGALTLVAGSPAEAHGWRWKHGWHHHPPVATAPPTSTPTPTPTATPTPEPTDGPDNDAAFSETFDTDAPAGQFASTYSDGWQPYPDGMSGKYYSGQVISAHDGVMDVTLDGKRGAAGTFGTPDGAWSHVGGTFSIRAKALGGDGNGAAVMLWPTSNVWSDGELDYPEGNFDGAPNAFNHSMVKGQEASAQQVSTGVTWRDWHTYTTDWEPGQYVRYYVDGDLIGTVTHDVPTTAHRYMFQLGNYGQPGHFLIDWVSTDD